MGVSLSASRAGAATDGSQWTHQDARDPEPSFEVTAMSETSPEPTPPAADVPKPASASPPPRRSWGTAVWTFMGNPVVSLIGTIGTLAGIVVSVWLYQGALRDPELVYSLHPDRTLIVDKDRPSDLQVSFAGQPLQNTQVSSLKVAVWNRGHASIRSENVIEPVFIALKPPLPILTARIVQGTHDYTGIALDLGEAAHGRVGVSWKILDHLDGAAIQIIYAGTDYPSVRAVGVIESQGEPRRQFGRAPAGMVMTMVLLGLPRWIAITIGCFALLALFRMSLTANTQRGWRVIVRVAIVFVSLVLVGVLSLILVALGYPAWHAAFDATPFGF